MKPKIYTIFLIVFLSTLSAFSQDVFPTSDAVWNIGNSSREREWLYGLSGDTIVNDTTYQKLYFLNDTTLEISAEDTYIGGFRQENKKVWFRPNTFNEWDGFEILLFDFAVNIGDTIHHGCFYPVFISSIPSFVKEGYEQISIVTDIQEVDGMKQISIQRFRCYEDGDYLPIAFGGWGTDIWVEGIGSIYRGLFWMFYEPSMCSTLQAQLSCLKVGYNVKFINNPNCNSCFCWSTASLKENVIEKIKVFQMPETDYIQIKGDNSIFPCHFNLINLNGQKVFGKIILTESDPILITKELKGVYLYQIQKNDGSILKTEKLIL